jgi:arylsulfatase A-like enzyme
VAKWTTQLARIGIAAALAAAAGCREPSPAPRRIVLVTVDTLRADHLGCYGYPRRVSPFIDRLAREGVRFEHAYATSSTTVTCHASLFTSLYPTQHRLLRNGEVLHDTVFTMAQLFQRLGYQTAAFTTVGFVRSLDRGFDTFDAEKKYFPARHVVDKTIRWLETKAPADRLFLWVHLFDVHEWYHRDHLDEEFRGVAATRTDMSRGDFVAYLEKEQGISTSFFGDEATLLDVVDRYDDQILSADAQLERFYGYMEDAGMNDGALWVLTSDHGEGLGGHQFRGHGAKIYNEQVRVPLVFHFTDGGHAGAAYAGITVGRMARHVDVLPTLAEILSASLDDQVFPAVGASLLPLFEDPEAEVPVRYSFSQRRDADEQRLAGGWEPGEVYSLQTLDYKYIFKSAAEHEFYELSNDPVESVNLVGEPSEVKDRMQAYLTDLYSRMSRQGDLLGRSEILPEHVEELKALGYL